MKIRKNNGNYKTSLVPYTNINNEKLPGLSFELGLMSEIAILYYYLQSKM